MARKLFILFFGLLLNIEGFSENYYWVGGSGDWSDISHWATSSGGSVTHLTTPSAGDNVFFDVNSFSAANQTVTINGNLAFALNLTFDGVQFSPRFVANTNTTLQIHGSIRLNPNMSFDFLGNIEFAGFQNDLTIDFAGHDAGTNLIFIGSGTWNINGTVNVSNSIDFRSGRIMLNDSRVFCEFFYSRTSNLREIDFGNAEIHIYGRTDDPFFLGSVFNQYSVEINTTNWQSSSGSSQLIMENDYSKIWIIGNSNPTFGSISTTSSQGQFGLIYYQQMAGSEVIIDGNLNIRNNGELYSNLRISGDLVLAPAKRYEFQSGRTFDLQRILATADCGNIISMRSSASGESATINAGQNYTIAFVSLQDIHHLGMTGTVENGLNLGNNQGWVINEKVSETLYWVGNSGNWSNPTNWSFTSGGPGSGCIPSIVDNVVFDSASFQSDDQLLIIDLDNATCRNMTWDGIRPGCGFSGSNNQNMFLSGSLVFNGNMSNQFAGDFYFIGAGADKTIRTNGIPFNGDLYFDNRDAGWILQDDVYVQFNMHFNSGMLDFNGVVVDLNQFISNGTNIRTLLLRSSIIYLRERNFTSPQWSMWSDNHTLDAGTSEIVFDDQTGYFLLYGANSLRFHNIRFFCIFESAESYLFNQPAEVNIMELRGQSYMYGQFVIDTLILDAGGWHYFDERTEKTIGFLQGAADCEGLVSMSAISSRTEPARIRFLQNQILNGYYIKDITALSPSGTITAINSVNGGGNSGFTFTNATGRTLYWVNDTGDWYDPMHWSLSSGGPAGQCPPTPIDNVIIDDLSFSGNNGFISSPNTRNCFARDFTFSKSNFDGSISMIELKVFGSFRLLEPFNYQINLVQTEGNAVEQRIFTNGTPLTNLYIASVGSVILEDDIVISNYFNIYSGVVRAENLNLRSRYFSMGNFLTPPDVLLTDCTFEIYGEHQPFNSPFGVFSDGTLFASSSTIRLSNQQTGMTFRYGDVILGEVIASDPQGFSDMSFYTDIGVRKLILRGSGLFKSFDFALNGRLTADSLILTAGRAYQFQSGSNTRVQSYLQARGNNCNPISVSSTIINERAFLQMNSNTDVNADFIEMRDIAALGGTFNAGPYSTNINNSNPGWIFPDINEVSDTDGFLGPDRFLCEGAILTLDANNYTPTETYIWSDGTTLATLEVSEAGIYYVEIRFDNNCIVRDTIEVFSPQSFENFLPANSTVCDNIPVLLNADLGVGGATYLWQDGSTNATYTVDQSGIYSVVVTIDGCEFSDSAEVSFIELPLPDLGMNIQSCEGEVVVLSVEDFSGSILWSNGSNSDQISVNQSGVYWVQFSEDICTSSDTVTVVFNPIPFFSLGEDQSICDGEEIILNPDIPGSEVLWQDGTTEPQIVVTQTGNYSATVTLAGCSFTDQIFITFRPLPIFSLGDDIRACEDDQVILRVNVDDALVSWQDGSISDQYEVTESGLYIATALLSGCVYSDEVNVFFIQIPDPALGNDTTICDGETLVLTLPVNDFDVVWSDGSTLPNISIKQEGLYWVEISQESCSKSDSIFVELAALPSLDMAQEYFLCEDSSITIVPNGTFDTFIWTQSNISGSLTVSTGGVLDYSVVLGQCADVGIIIISEVFLPDIDLGDDRIICRQEQLTLTPTPFNTDYIWQDGSVGSDYQVSESGIYEVTLSEYGCTASAQVQVVVEECNDQILLFPNVFAPGTGNVNGEFKPVKGNDVQIFDYKLSIFDRWGNLLYSSTDYQEAWNGRYSNDFINPGVYIYRATGRYSFGIQENIFDIKGDVTVLR